MTNNDKPMQCDNVNGVAVYLNVERGKGFPKSITFTISYKNEKNKSIWPYISLFLAIIFNILAISYVRISLNAVLVILIVLSVLMLFWVTHSVQTESLLVIPAVGLQSSIKYVVGSEDNFVSWAAIDDVIINEVVKLNRVLYFLTVLVKGSSDKNQDNDPVKLIPQFKYTKPRLAMIQAIYSELQTLLVESQKDDIGAGDKG